MFVTVYSCVSSAPCSKLYRIQHNTDGTVEPQYVAPLQLPNGRFRILSSVLPIQYSQHESRKSVIATNRTALE